MFQINLENSILIFSLLKRWIFLIAAIQNITKFCKLAKFFDFLMIFTKIGKLFDKFDEIFGKKILFLC